MEPHIRPERSNLHTPPMAALVSATAALAEDLASLDWKVSRGGRPSPRNEQRFHSLFSHWNGHLQQALGEGSDTDARIRSAVARWVRDRLQPYLLRSEIGYRAIRKPAGYAGDFKTILHVYGRRPQGRDAVGELVDAALLKIDAAWAVFHRRELLAGEIRRTHAGVTGRAVRVTSLACGPAEELQEAYRVLDGDCPLDVILIDIDQDALDHATHRLAHVGMPHLTQALRCNLIQVAQGRRRVDLPPQDLIYSAGLLDYLDDDVVVGLLDAAHGWLAPGGRLIVGNVHPCNPDRALLDHVFDWPLIHRSEADMDRLLGNSRFGRPCTRIRFEPQGLNLFAECYR